MTPPPDRPFVLVVGGTGGLLGRALRSELAREFRVRSVHRRPDPAETRAGFEWVAADIGLVRDWNPILQGVRFVVNVAWYRTGPPIAFESLAGGLLRLIEASRTAGVERFIQVSVPAAPENLERGLPYLVHKRRVDASLSESGLSYRIVRPTAMFGDRDVLLGVMFRMIRRYPWFPMFGDGEYHLSPIAAEDVARAIRLELERPGTGVVDLGGPTRFRYRDLTDLMFHLNAKRPRYWRFGDRASIRLARILERLGSNLLYAYEVEWLLSDLLGPPPYAGLDRPLARAEDYLERLARGAPTLGPVPPVGSTLG